MQEYTPLIHGGLGTYDTLDTNKVKLNIGIISAITLGTLVFFFLTTFFFVYVSDVENEIFRDEVSAILDEVQRVSDTVDKTFNKEGKRVRLPIPTNELRSNPEDVKNWKQRNDEVRSSAIQLCLLVLGGLLLCTAISAYFLPEGQRLELLGKVWLRALLYLTFIGTLEWLFLNIVTSQFKTVAIVKLKQKLMMRVQEVMTYPSFGGLIK